MLFCEPIFLFAFLPLSLFLYYLAPSASKNWVLICISCIFYAAGEAHFVGWLTASVLINFIVARGLQVIPERYRLPLLFAGITSDLALLFAFKYLDFFIANVNEVATAVHLRTFKSPHLALPLGISFFTFHKISYKVDVYRDPKASGRSFSELCLYILLYPQLLAGPIIRYKEVVHQLRRRVHDVHTILKGMRRFVFGLTKKLFIANAMGLCADQIFGVAGQIDGVPLQQLNSSVAWFGAVAYSLQIYFDFSGYSDMAIGLGSMLGFTFPENFDYPYISASITEFWRRWHMSLSRWFRDYLYIPLGGNRAGPIKLYANLMTVFLLCGLWHGASWNFIIWGLWHGILLVAERRFSFSLPIKLKRPIGHFYTLICVAIGWVFFRAETLGEAVGYLSVMFSFGITSEPAAHYQTVSWWLDGYTYMALMAGILGSTPWWRVAVATVRRRQVWRRSFSSNLALLTQVAVCVFLFVFSTMIISAGAYSPFIYFRF